MSAIALHYLHDPLCGWCYGAAPLVRSARAMLPVVAHGGGMMAGDNRQRVSPRLRNFVMQHDRRIAELTAQPFGAAYFDGLLRDPGAVFDSEPPTAAMLAADELSGTGLDLLARMQNAHFVQGRRIADESVLCELASDIGLDRQAFRTSFDRLRAAPTWAHMLASRKLLARLGGAGFPTFALEREGRFEVIEAGAHLGRVDSWTSLLKRYLASASGS